MVSVAITALTLRNVSQVRVSVLRLPSQHGGGVAA